ncbi:MAG: hypothetical protein LBJ35_05810 [Spirochaetaceae bacterium]|jgi:hypothetical protein|nr:hypothetical protein [Spirochaetaceae bacterium]
MKASVLGKMIFTALIAARFIFAAAADTADETARKDFDNDSKPFGFDILESGSWVDGGHFSNRLDMRLHTPLELTLRGQLNSKYPAPPWEYPDDGINALGAALYHKGTGSRLLYGRIETRGLLNRASNMWSRSAPWFESHSVSNADLKTSAGDMETAVVYMDLLTPAIGPFNSYFSAQFDKETNTIFTGGAGVRLPFNSAFRLEALSAEKRLAERKMDAWFSDKPYLPERDLRFYALNAVFSSPYFSFAGDFAYSEVFAWGMDIYANAALRFGAGPWRFSLAADGAGARFSGADGSIPGAGFRSAAQFTWEGRRNMLFRASSVLRSAAWRAPFDRSATSLYFRFPVNKSSPLRVNRVSLAVERDAQSWERISDNVSFGAIFSAGPFRPLFNVTLSQHTSANVGDTIYPYPNYAADHEFDTLKFSGGVSCMLFFISLKGTVSYNLVDEKEAQVTSSVSASINGKLGRIGVKLSDDGKNGKLSYSVSWRLQKSF